MEISGHAWQAGHKRRDPIPLSGGHLNTSSSDALQPTTHCLGADTQQRWTSWSPHDPGKAEGMFLLARVPADVEKWIWKCEPCQRRNRTSKASSSTWDHHCRVPLPQTFMGYYGPTAHIVQGALLHFSGHGSLHQMGGSISTMIYRIHYVGHSPGGRDSLPPWSAHGHSQ